MSKRLIVLSDSHGASDRLRDAVRQAMADGRVDMVAFLGDGMEDFDQLRPMLTEAHIGICAVRGNNDWDSCEPMQAVFSLNGIRFLATHGHGQHVKWNLERLYLTGLEKEAQVILYGHTHEPKADIFGGVQLLCPGAVCNAGRGSAVYLDIIA